jgi:hypothetical protein
VNVCVYVWVYVCVNVCVYTSDKSINSNCWIGQRTCGNKSIGKKSKQFSIIHVWQFQHLWNCFPFACCHPFHIDSMADLIYVHCNDCGITFIFFKLLPISYNSDISESKQHEILKCPIQNVIKKNWNASILLSTQGLVLGWTTLLASRATLETS